MCATVYVRVYVVGCSVFIDLLLLSDFVFVQLWNNRNCLCFCVWFQVEKSGSVNLHRTPDPSTFPSVPGTPRVVNVTENSVTLTWTKTQDRAGASPLIG